MEKEKDFWVECSYHNKKNFSPNHTEKRDIWILNPNITYEQKNELKKIGNKFMCKSCYSNYLNSGSKQTIASNIIIENLDDDVDIDIDMRSSPRSTFSSLGFGDYNNSFDSNNSYEKLLENVDYNNIFEGLSTKKIVAKKNNIKKSHKKSSKNSKRNRSKNNLKKSRKKSSKSSKRNRTKNKKLN
jgi:hypothetical protein